MKTTTELYRLKTFTLTKLAKIDPLAFRRLAKSVTTKSRINSSIFSTMRYF